MTKLPNPVDRLDVDTIPTQLQDVVDDRRCWRAIHIDGELAGAIGFNPAAAAGALYLSGPRRWLVFWPVDRDALDQEVAAYLRGRFSAKIKSSPSALVN